MPRLADPLARAKLLRAARTVFARQGLADARVEDIARSAGLAKGSFYRHFEGKDDAFLHIVDAFLADVGRQADAYGAAVAACRTRAGVRRALRQKDERMLEFLWAHRDLLRMIHACGPRYGHVLEGFLEAQGGQIAENIRTLQARGIYRAEVDPEACAWVIAGGWDSLSRLLMRLEAKPSVRKWVDTMHGLFLEGLLRR